MAAEVAGITITVENATSLTNKGFDIHDYQT